MGATTIKVVATWELGPWLFSQESLVRKWTCGSESVRAARVIRASVIRWKYSVFDVHGGFIGGNDAMDVSGSITRSDELLESYIKQMSIGPLINHQPAPPRQATEVST